jgi:site-specific recombinase XerD
MLNYWELDIEFTNPENTKVVNAFLLFQKELHSKRTVIRHRNLLQWFFCTHSEPFTRITREEILQWLIEQEKDRTEHTIERYLSSIRTFYHYTVMEKHMEISPLPIKKKVTGEYWVLDIEFLIPENAEIVNAFLLSQNKKNKSKSTIFRQRSVLKRFFKNQKKEFTSITKEDVEHWIAEQEKYNIVGENYLKPLRIFFNFTVMEKCIEISPLHDNNKPVTSHERYWELKILLPNHENQTFINQFLFSLKNAERKKQSIVGIRVNLQHFFKNNQKPFHSINLEEIEQWVKERQSSQKEQQLSALRSFYEFCWEEGIMAEPPLRSKCIYKNSTDRYWEIHIRLPNEENKTVINEFLLNLKDKNRCRRTINGYRVFLQLYFYKTDIHFSLLEPRDIEVWFKETKSNMIESTMRNYMGALRCFYNFCNRKTYMHESLIKYKWEKENDKKNYWESYKPIKNIENKEAINEYLLNMKIANRSRGTIILNKSILETFFRSRDKFSTLAPDDILEWLVQIQRNLKESTVRGRFSTLSSFFKFCIEEGYMEKTPIKSRWNPRLPKSLPKYLEKGEVAKIRQVSEKEKLRNRLIVEFLLSSGCRIGEINMLNKSDVDLENRSAIVTGKGKKIRRIHFSETCAILLERYYEACQYDDHPAVFLSNYVTRLSKYQMYDIVRGIGDEAGIVGTLHPHRFRHTFATELAIRGANLSFIADELGHASIETTQRYARLPKWKLILLYRMYMG